MGYTTCAQSDLIGLGVSAISHIGDSFSQNPRDLRGWEAALDEGHLPVWRGLELDSDDVLRGDVIEQMMCQGEIDVVAVEHRYGIRFWDYFPESQGQLQELASDGLVVLTSGRIAATPRGRLLLRVIAMCFDRYVRQP
jgi:oxygen-independent coproporphyrinogen-3 oxidase